MEFKHVLRTNIQQTIKRSKRAGITGMSLDCLRQNTPTPSQSLKGAPQGTNAQWVYSELFADICREDAGIRRFVTGGL